MNTPFLALSGLLLAVYPEALAGTAATPPPAAGLPAKFEVLEVLIFVPKWTGAEGFSAGKKYVAQGTGFYDGRTRWSDGDQFLALPQDGSAPARFEIVAGSLKREHVELRPVEHAGSTHSSESTIFLIPQPVINDARLVLSIDTGERPNGEAKHEFSFGIDINGDGMAEYAEFVHHCKESSAPYPMDRPAQKAWDAEHGEVDWDYTCSNVYTKRAGKWVKGERKTPM